MKEVIELIKEAKWYFGLSLLVSTALSINTSFTTAMAVNLVMNFFAARIGLDAIMIKLIQKVNSTSRKINEIHFNQLVNDTHELNGLYNKLGNGDIDEVKLKLALMISANNNTINSIKLAKNGAEQ